MHAIVMVHKMQRLALATSATRNAAASSTAAAAPAAAAATAAAATTEGEGDEAAATTTIEEEEEEEGEAVGTGQNGGEGGLGRSHSITSNPIKATHPPCK